MMIQEKAVLDVDKTSRAEWDSIINTFSDATFFQTWEYGIFAWGEENLSHAVLKLNDRAVAAVQVRISSFFPGLKYAYISYGPMWKTKEVPSDCDVLELMMKALVKEYVQNRGYTLRVVPFIHDGDYFVESIRGVFLENGFINKKTGNKTLVLELSSSLEELRKNMRRNWRRCLRQSEEAGLTLTVSKSSELFLECLSVYKKMHKRKDFIENVSMDDFLALHKNFPDEYKFTILTVGKEDQIHSCQIFTTIGDTGFPILTATTRSGLENNASYLAMLEMIKVFHDEDIHWIDFRGIDPENNRGVYYFKTGVSGKKGREVCYLGDFDYYSGNLARMIIAIIEKGRFYYHSTKSILRKYF